MLALAVCNKVGCITRLINQPIKTLYLILAIALFVFCAVVFQKNAPQIIEWINGLGWLAPVLFLITYCLATLLFLPTMVWTLAGGALFGPVWGTALNLISATSGAAIAFLISRHWLYDWISQLKNRRLHKLISDVERGGWMVVALLRFFPILPFNLVNYGLGITGIRFRVYLITTFAALIIPEILYTYCGYAGRDALMDPQQFYNKGGVFLLITALSLLIIIKVIQWKKSRNAEADRASAE